MMIDSQAEPLSVPFAKCGASLCFKWRVEVWKQLENELLMYTFATRITRTQAQIASEPLTSGSHERRLHQAGQGAWQRDRR